jgi:hypothetical protein
MTLTVHMGARVKSVARWTTRSQTTSAATVWATGKNYIHGKHNYFINRIHYPGMGSRVRTALDDCLDIRRSMLRHTVPPHGQCDDVLVLQ